MSALAQVVPFVTVEEYLAAEELSDTKHEYLDGIVCEMAGASDSHARLVTSLNSTIDAQLQGKRCEFLGNDMRLLFTVLDRTYYYYPDGMVVCDPTDGGNGFREHPTVIFEIISESTRSMDERRKRRDYRSLESVEAYVRIEQERPEVIVERRTKSRWEEHRFAGLGAVAELGVLGLSLPLSRLYARVVFPA